MGFILNRQIAICLVTLILSGCVTFTPEKMYEGEIKSKKDVATIMGQHKKTWNHDMLIFVSKVDGKETFSTLTSITFPNVIYVDPGVHELEVHAGYGSMRHPKSPTIRVNVEAGQVYQIDSQLMRTANGGTGANYSLRHIGNTEEYEDYLAKHPEYEPGSLLSTLGGR